MKVLSLFDGMACGMLAMMDAGFAIDRYVAFEIDKYAVQTSSHNFHMIEHRGDVFQADFKEFYGFDLLIGGSPCTYWSIAQKNNRETVASGMGWELFSQYVRALHEAKPKLFIYENNKSMSGAIRASIDEAFGFEAVCINSALVSAQNRQRLYWVGKRNEDGTYSRVDVSQPEDRGILLRDILESGDGPGFKELSEREMEYMVRETRDGRNHFDFDHHHDATKEKSACLTANTHKGVPYNVLCEPICVAERGRYEDGTIVQRFEARLDGKSNVLTTVQKDNNVAEPVRVGTWPNNAKNQAHDSQQYRIYSADGKSVTLCGNGGGMGAKTWLYAIPVEFDGNSPIKAVSCADGKTYTVYKVDGGQITIKDKQYPIKLPDGFYIIRKLTVRECMRLQTVPEWFEFPVSDAQAYKMLGNGWTVRVIAHLLQHIPQESNKANDRFEELCASIDRIIERLERIEKHMQEVAM